MLETILTGLLGVVLLVFCVVDLYHLKEMLRVLRNLDDRTSHVYGIWLSDRGYR